MIRPAWQSLLKLPHAKEQASRPTPPNTLRLLPPNGGKRWPSCLPFSFLLQCFMLWDELRWCCCWIITPWRGIANTCRGVREKLCGFKGIQCQEQRSWVGESTRWYGLDQLLSEAKLASVLLSIYVMEMSSDKTMISPIATLDRVERWNAKTFWVKIINLDGAIMTAADAFGGALWKGWMCFQRLTVLQNCQRQKSE